MKKGVSDDVETIGVDDLLLFEESLRSDTGVTVLGDGEPSVLLVLSFFDWYCFS